MREERSDSSDPNPRMVILSLSVVFAGVLLDVDAILLVDIEAILEGGRKQTMPSLRQQEIRKRRRKVLRLYWNTNMNLSYPNLYSINICRVIDLLCLGAWR